MKFLLGKKLGMSQIFDEKTGKVTPLTLVDAGPCFVAQVKTKERDGYEALQVSFDLKKKNNKPRFRREFRLAPVNFKVGDKIDAAIFAEGDKVKISGISKSKGFQGGVKRHGFSGGPRTHGQKHSEREVGSIGSVRKVIKGQRMSGRMGGEKTTIRGLRVVKVDLENNLIAILGAIPGRRGGLVEIRGE